jgi:hypothetical protein
MKDEADILIGAVIMVVFDSLFWQRRGEKSVPYVFC